MAEQTFRRLNAAELLPLVYTGVKYQGMEAGQTDGPAGSRRLMAIYTPLDKTSDTVRSALVVLARTVVEQNISRALLLEEFDLLAEQQQCAVSLQLSPGPPHPPAVIRAV